MVQADRKVEAVVKPPRLIKYRGQELKLRKGRGFSVRELREVGLTPEEARKLGIPVDIRRRSLHEWNVKILKTVLGGEKGQK